MSKQKRLLVMASFLPHHTDAIELQFHYGASEDMGALLLHADDLSEFIEGLRHGFEETLQVSSAKRNDNGDT